VPKGDILSQNPTPDQGKVNSGSTVTVTLSAGVQTTTVPAFDPAGSTTLSSYEAQLTGSQLVPGAQLSEAYSDAPVGDVINVVPTPYSTLDVNSPVAITVSAGVAPLPVPAVTGKTLSAATQLLKASGFLILEKEDFSNTVPSGSVIAQDPYAGVNGKVGDTVTIDVSKGPQLFEIPNVVSPSVLHVVTVSSATKTLEKDGFVVKVNRGDLLVAIVSGQSPKAGTLAPAGTVVTISTP
jgi:beta-lactam-binding protein with PASTA domain